MTSPCIYAIWFPTANDMCVYVGQTRRSLSVRRSDHLGNIRLNRPWSFKLYNWMRERMAADHKPEFLLLEECEVESLARLEDQWQRWFRDSGWEAKHLKGGEPNAGGYKLTEEHKAKLAAAKLGKKRGPMSEETKRKIGNANRGIKRTPDQIERNRQYRLGSKQSPEHVAKRMEAIAAKTPEERADQYRRATETRLKTLQKRKIANLNDDLS